MNFTDSRVRSVNEVLVRLFAIAPLGKVRRPYYQVIGQGHNPCFLIYYSTVLVYASSCCVCTLTGVQYLSEALVAIQRLQQLLDLPNEHGLNTSSEANEVVLNLLKQETV